jgi:hypothetical protein
MRYDVFGTKDQNAAGKARLGLMMTAEQANSWQHLGTFSRHTAAFEAARVSFNESQDYKAVRIFRGSQCVGHLVDTVEATNV